MARRKPDSSQKAALWEMMSNYMKENDVRIKDGKDVNSIMRDMISIILEGTLDTEMDEELGYSKYDYKNKDIKYSDSASTIPPGTPGSGESCPAALPRIL